MEMVAAQAVLLNRDTTAVAVAYMEASVFATAAWTFVIAALVRHPAHSAKPITYSLTPHVLEIVLSYPDAANAMLLSLQYVWTAK
jgi:hypothetical protein